MLKTRAWIPYAYIAPAVLLLGFVFAYPVAQVVNFSFRLIRGNSGPWVGLNNYRLIFDDPTFIAAAKHSALLLIAVPVLLVLSGGVRDDRGRRLVEQARGRGRLPIIGLVEPGDAGDRDACRELGLTECFIKPVEIDDVAA